MPGFLRSFDQGPLVGRHEDRWAPAHKKKHRMTKRKTSTAAERPRPASADYTVLARRYRPQQFEQLIGQEPVAQALRNALATNRVAHAYLFTGPRGVGKTSAARILAKALNCVRGPTDAPCDECEICLSIASGEDVDVLEIDGASNRGIDEIREIRHNVQYRPARARYKIYIVDEVHMLTPPAFNALLKTLEEPPPHVKFIFATTEVQKIPVTILSRCQRFDFAGISTQRIAEQLRSLIKQEGVGADDEAIELIARRAGGSMRDSQSLLDQLLAFGTSGERLTTEQVHRLFGTADEDRVASLATAITSWDPSAALAEVDKAAQAGLNLAELLDQLIDYWRDLMVVNCSGDPTSAQSVGTRYRDALAKQARSLPLDTVLAGLDLLSWTKARLRGSNHPRAVVESAVVRLARLGDLLSADELAELVSGKAGKTASASGQPRAERPMTPRAAMTQTQPVKPVQAEKKNPDAAPTAAVEVALSESSLPHVWSRLKEEVGPMLGSNLGCAAIAITGPKTLVLRFGTGYNVEQEYCQEPARLARIEECFRRITGQAWAVRTELVGTDAAAPPIDSTISRHRRQRTEAMQEPLVQRAAEVLGAQVVHMDDGFGAALRDDGETTEES
jgi:DNA polymerase-3 subunit gamma/tau